MERTLLLQKSLTLVRQDIEKEKEKRGAIRSGRGAQERITDSMAFALRKTSQADGKDRRPRPHCVSREVRSRR